MIEIISYTAAFLLSLLGVDILRRWIVKRGIFDVPNERSSHLDPTPRGGGLIIVIISLGFYVFGSFILPINFHWSYFIGALGIALISWFDDLISISIGWRFLVHSAAAFLLIWNLGYWHEIYLPFFGVVPLGFWGAILTFSWIIWLTNAFNFMDGIDGIAGMQAVIAGFAWLIIGKMLGIDSTAIYGGIIAFASLGFLIHNWEPAKIFMGDVGSAFLGYSFAAIAIFPGNYSNSRIPIIAVLVVFCFVFDSALTFLIRTVYRKRVWEAHREHIYQKLVIKGYSHRAVSLIYGGLSVVIVLGIIIFLNP